jgi:hypothetical protein
MDVRVRDRIEAFFEERIRLPEYAPLIPYWNESESIYRARKAEQLDVISAWDTQKQVADARANAAKERTGRETAEKSAAQLLKRLEEVESENVALRAAATADVKEAPKVLNSAIEAPVQEPTASEMAAPAKAAAANDIPASEPAKTPATPENHKFTAEEITKAIQEANDLVKAGKDLSSLTPRQLEIVEVKPAERQVLIEVAGGKKEKAFKDGVPVMEVNPFAGKVGLTNAANQSVNGVMFTSGQALKNKDISKVDHDKHTARLSAYGEARAAARSSMGLSPKEEPAQGEIEHEIPPLDG